MTSAQGAFLTSVFWVSSDRLLAWDLGPISRKSRELPYLKIYISSFKSDNYLKCSCCFQGSLALGRLVSIPIALFLSPAVMLLVDLVSSLLSLFYHLIDVRP